MSNHYYPSSSSSSSYYYYYYHHHDDNNDDDDITHPLLTSSGTQPIRGKHDASPSCNRR